jgi:hypothetical protein
LQDRLQESGFRFVVGGQDDADHGDWDLIGC